MNNHGVVFDNSPPNKNSGSNKPPVTGVLPPALQKLPTNATKRSVQKFFGKGPQVEYLSPSLIPQNLTFSSSSKEIRFWSSCWIISVKAVASGAMGWADYDTRSPNLF